MDGKEFAEHRSRVISVFKENGITEGVVAFKSNPLLSEPFTGSDYPFSQEGNFYWLTGWEKPDSAIFFDIATGHSILFIPKYSDHYEIWNGPIPDPEDVKAISGTDEILFMPDFEEHVQAAGKKVYGALKQIHIEGVEVNNHALISACGIARRIKSEYEIEQLRKASSLTSDAVVHVMNTIQPGWTEMEVDAEFTYYGLKKGAREKSFLTIAASGKNSVYLHSSANEGVCNDGELLLLDCGFFWNHYAGDVTRTFPVNGKFTEDQKRVYNLLLKKQIELIDMVKPDLTFQDMNNAMFRATFDICKELGIITTDEYSDDLARLFTPHSLTHHVGCNVHDVNYSRSEVIKDSWQESRTCKKNMVITIEPGVYFHKPRFLKLKDDPKYEGRINWDLAMKYCDSVAGIRIEDDVLVTETGHEVISTCPKTVEEIEAIMRKHFDEINHK